MRDRRRISSLCILALLVGPVGVSGALAGAAAIGSVATLPASSCGRLVYEGEGSPELVVVSNLPARGKASARTAAMTEAIELVLAERGFRAGRWTVGYRSCDDSTARAGGRDAAKCVANAAAFAAERRVVGVIGTGDDVCAALMIPILGRAPDGRVVMVSPSNTAAGLTKAVSGFSGPGEPDVHYPTGERNFVRVVTTDDQQPAALAQLTARLRKTSAFLLGDGSSRGQAIAEAYAAAVSRLGVEVVGRGTWKASGKGYDSLARRISRSGAQVVLLGGRAESSGARLLRDLRAGLGEDVVIMATDGFTPISSLVEKAGSAAEGLYVSVVGTPNEQLGGAGRAFVRRLTRRLGTNAVTPHAVSAAQAATVLLDAIERSNGTRSSVTERVFGTNVEGGLLGSFRFDRRGDTSRRVVSIFRVANGRGVPDRLVVLE